MMTRTLIAVSLCSIALVETNAPRAQRPDHPEAPAILAAALDYGEGWYDADPERMHRALHPELAKRMVFTDGRSGRSRLSQQSAMTLVENTRAGGGKNSPVGDQPSRAEILDVYGNAAVVKVVGPEWVDYLQMARWNGRWVIVNVLWELHPDRAPD